EWAWIEAEIELAVDPRHDPAAPRGTQDNREAAFEVDGAHPASAAGKRSSRRSFTGSPGDQDGLDCDPHVAADNQAQPPVRHRLEARRDCHWLLATAHLLSGIASSISMIGMSSSIG